MSLMSALNAAVSGLRATQAGIDLTSQNIANAQSVGYTRRTISNVQELTGTRTSGVRTGEIERVLDQMTQKQLRLETSGASYTNVRASFATALDKLFGPPGSSGALDSALNAFTTALSGLAGNPSDYSARAAVLDRAQALASRISTAAQGVQALRTGAEARIGSAVGRANELLSGIAGLNARMAPGSAGADSAALADQRDTMINELAGLMDVQAQVASDGTVRLSTTSGQTLLDGTTAIRLEFDARAALTPEMSYDPLNPSVGVITGVSANGSRTDLIATGAFRSGEIGASLEARDETLVQAQRQLDELAAGLSRALSDRSVTGTRTGASPASAFSLDLQGLPLQPGNAIALDYTPSAGAAARSIILIPTNGAAGTVPASATQNPNATVVTFPIGADLATTAANIQAALNGAVPGGFTVGVGVPATALSFADAAAGVDITGVSTSISITGLASGEPELPFFVDAGRGGAAYTGSFENVSQLTGFAQRIGVNRALINDPSRLVVSGTGVPQGDTERPQAMVDALTTATRTFSAAAGIGGSAAPFTASVGDFARRVVDTQGANAEAAMRLDEGQGVALAAAQSRFSEVSGVNIDQEMAQLVQLQTSYGANARVMTAVRDMMDMLLRI